MKSNCNKETVPNAKADYQAALAKGKIYLVTGFLLMCTVLSVVLFVMGKAGQRAGQEPASIPKDRSGSPHHLLGKP